METDAKPAGFATLAELIAAVIDYERAQRRQVSEAQWPTIRFYRRTMIGMIKRRDAHDGKNLAWLAALVGRRKIRRSMPCWCVG
jgi:hypothetical protein